MNGPPVDILYPYNRGPDKRDAANVPWGARRRLSLDVFRDIASRSIAGNPGIMVPPESSLSSLSMSQQPPSCASGSTRLPISSIVPCPCLGCPPPYSVPDAPALRYRGARSDRTVRPLPPRRCGNCWHVIPFPNTHPATRTALSSLPKVDLHENVSRSGQLSGTERHLETKSVGLLRIPGGWVPSQRRN